HGLSVEISSRDYIGFQLSGAALRPDGRGACPRLAALKKNQRIVHCGVDLNFHDLAAMGERIPDSAMHLWHAAQGVRVLDPAAIAMRLAKLATFEHLAQIRRSLKLAGMGPRFMNALVKGDIRASQRAQGERPNHVPQVYNDLHGATGENANREHSLRPVDQRDRFLRLEHQRLDLGAAHSFSGWNTHSLFIQTLTFADQRQGQMSQWGQIAARSYAPLRGHHRRDTAIQHLANRIDND